MKSFLTFSILLSLFSLSTLAEVLASTQGSLKVRTIAILSAHTKESYQSNLEPILLAELKDCKSCEFKNITPYSADGVADFSQFAAVLGGEPSRPKSSTGGSEKAFSDNIQYDILFVDWNIKYSPEWKTLTLQLQQLIDKGVLVIGAAGVAKEGQDTVALSRTIWGQLPQVIVIGEINQRERMPKQSFFGPEMLTAVKPPREYDEKGIAPAFFVTRLAHNLNKKSNADWISYFREKKQKSKKVWPGLEEFFK